jgi:hypothetical protein
MLALLAATIFTAIAPMGENLCVCIKARAATAPACQCVPECQIADIWVVGENAAGYKALPFVMPISKASVVAAYHAAVACRLTEEAARQQARYRARYGVPIP